MLKGRPPPVNRNLRAWLAGVSSAYGSGLQTRGGGAAPENWLCFAEPLLLVRFVINLFHHSTCRYFSPPGDWLCFAKSALAAPLPTLPGRACSGQWREIGFVSHAWLQHRPHLPTGELALFGAPGSGGPSLPRPRRSAPISGHPGKLALFRTLDPGGSSLSRLADPRPSVPVRGQLALFVRQGRDGILE